MKQDIERIDWTSVYLTAFALVIGGMAALVIFQFQNTLQLLVVFFVICATLVAIGKPELGLAALIFMIYVRFSGVLVYYHGAPSVAKYYVPLLSIVVIGRALLNHQRIVGWEGPTLVFGAYGLIGVGSLLYAVSSYSVLAAIDDYVKDVLIAIVVIMLIQRADNLRQAVWALLVAGIFMGTISVYQQLTGNFANNFGGFGEAGIQNIVGETNSYRVAGPIGDPNFYAQAMVVLVPLAIDRWRNERKRWVRWLAVFALLVCSLTIIFTYSRGGFLALLVVVALSFVHRRPSILAIPIITIIGALLVTFAPENYLDRLQTIPQSIPGFGDVRNEISIRGRASELTIAGLMFRDHPVWGVGWNNYEQHYLTYSQQVGLDPRREGRAAHNLFLQVAAESGVVGLILFGAILGLTGLRLQRAFSLAKQANQPELTGLVAAIFIAFVGYLVAALFLHGAYLRYFWLLAGIAMASHHAIANTLRVSSFKPSHVV